MADHPASSSLTETAIAQLAREMVMAIRNYKAIFADFGITEEHFYEISKTEYYKRVKDHYALEWNSALSAADRVRLISASYAEVALPVMGRRMIDPNEPLPAALDAFKQMCKNAGIGVNEKTDTASSAERFVITINLGADVEGKPVTEHYNKSIDVSPNDVDLSFDKGSGDVSSSLPAQAGTAEVPKRKRGRPRKETLAG